MILAIDSRVVTSLLVGGGIAIFGALLIATAAGELMGRRKAKVPIGMRPGPSDEQLERNVLESYMLWGALSTLVLALWLPAYWLREPTRLAQAADKFQTREVQEGELMYSDDPNRGFDCASCHGPGGEGGVRQFIVDGVSYSYAEPPLKYIYSRYAAAGRTEDETTQLIQDAIARGRPGTPMPTWSLAYGGPMNSAQIENMILYIQSIQEEYPEPANVRDGRALYDANCGICHNAPGNVDENPRLLGAGGIGPNLRVAFDRLSRQEVYDTIFHGRLNVNRPSMPTWAALGDRAIESLVRFIESIQRG